MSDYSAAEYIKLAIFYGLWLYFPVAALLIRRIAGPAMRTRIVAAFLLAPLTVFAYARFVEPRILLTREHAIELKSCFPEAGGVRLAVFSDTHIGLFGNAMPIRRIASRIRTIKPDAVMIAGDFVYFLQPDRFPETYASLGGVGAPVYGVLGNHDVGVPGPDVGAQLTTSLTDIGLSMIDNASTALSMGAGDVEIIGLSDTWQGKQDLSVLAPEAPAPRILLTHNPDTVFELPENASVDLLVAGHTHGGQIRIPGFTCAIFVTMCKVTLYGVAEYGPTTVFVTSGTGMVGLPMRFLVPPRVDVLDVSWRACQEPA